MLKWKTKHGRGTHWALTVPRVLGRRGLAEKLSFE